MIIEVIFLASIIHPVCTRFIGLGIHPLQIIHTPRDLATTTFATHLLSVVNVRTSILTFRCIVFVVRTIVTISIKPRVIIGARIVRVRRRCRKRKVRVEQSAVEACAGGRKGLALARHVATLCVGQRRITVPVTTQKSRSHERTSFHPCACGSARSRTRPVEGTLQGFALLTEALRGGRVVGVAGFEKIATILIPPLERICI
mmetsp:Transcript_30480/g.44529  ORF Transcript_30480/g.44529 Transcript_30480/m.44529 type:complete len:202 (+) Transcript_30480:1342-1947(+)